MLPFSSPQDAYKPRRKYRRQRGAEELPDEESRVHSTLLEYGRYRVGAGHRVQTQHHMKKSRVAAHTCYPSEEVETGR